MLLGGIPIEQLVLQLSYSNSILIPRPRTPEVIRTITGPQLCSIGGPTAIGGVRDVNDSGLGAMVGSNLMCNVFF